MWTKLQRTLEQLGLRESLLYYTSVLLSRVSGNRCRLIRYCIVAQPAGPFSGPPVARSKIASARQLRPGDPALATLPRPAEVIERRVANGDICLALFSDEILAGFLWLAFGAYEEDQVRCRYELGDTRLAWDYDVHVEPAFRMGRTFAQLWSAANGLLRDRGVTWSLSRISAFNAASLASHARLGARTLHRVTFLCIGRLEFAFLAGCRLPKVSFGQGGRPVVKLTPPTASGERLG